MINGDVNEFIDGLYYGDERFFLYNGRKYFIQGYYKSGKPMLELYVLEPSEIDFSWRRTSMGNNYPVADFESEKLFDGKSFWEIENKIEWVDA